jgi:hypothetical protein
MGKGDVLNGRRHVLAALHMLPRSIFLLLPLIPFPKPIRTPISPEMKIHVEMISGGSVEISNQEANMVRGHREPTESVEDK